MLCAAEEINALNGLVLDFVVAANFIFVNFIFVCFVLLKRNVECYWIN